MLPWIVLAIHLLCCLLVFLGIRSGLLRVHRYMAFVALFLPFWGLLVVLILHFQIALKADGAAEIGTEKFRVESELYRSVTVDETRVADSTVPIEEALLINSARERRGIIMDVLNDDPVQYIDFLRKAGNNDDTEVVHYAVTAMVEISKENDFRLQKLEREYAADPQNVTVLEKYTDFLWDCLSQHLMQGQVEVMNRELFATLIRHKVTLLATEEDYVRMITNDIKRGQYTEAGAALEEMRALWPRQEAYYLLKIQYLSMLGKGEEIRHLLSEIETEQVYISTKGKEALAFWET